MKIISDKDRNKQIVEEQNVAKKIPLKDNKELDKVKVIEKLDKNNNRDKEKKEFVKSNDIEKGILKNEKVRNDDVEKVIEKNSREQSREKLTKLYKDSNNFNFKNNDKVMIHEDNLENNSNYGLNNQNNSKLYFFNF